MQLKVQEMEQQLYIMRKESQQADVSRQLTAHEQELNYERLQQELDSCIAQLLDEQAIAVNELHISELQHQVQQMRDMEQQRHEEHLAQVAELTATCTRLRREQALQEEEKEQLLKSERLKMSAELRSMAEALQEARCAVLRTLDVGSHSDPGNRYAGQNQDFLVVTEMYNAGHGLLGDKSACYAGKALARNLLTSSLRNKHIGRMAPQDVMEAVKVVTEMYNAGHGLLGDKSACYAGKALARNLLTSSLRNKHIGRMAPQDVMEAVKAAFAKASQAANAVYSLPPKTVDYLASPGSRCLVQYTLQDSQASVKHYRTAKGHEKLLECGTTATTVVLQGGVLCLANVGDSLAVLGVDQGPGQGLSGHFITCRHFGLNPEEAERIRQQHATTTEVLEDYIPLGHP
ncbi:PPM-type phosphatase domain-containing protein [Haematococcus lacustris]|uniref:PPM-type phosphatase domain-containing protein n=1 Tax=Haematococcus lacustris TaxID=44745 RepID=A0A699ZHI2_HAELA|nr:PPM-type phosphatase domain-containing protein [Haematococcus lacustris]